MDADRRSVEESDRREDNKWQDIQTLTADFAEEKDRSSSLRATDVTAQSVPWKEEVMLPDSMDREDQRLQTMHSS